VVQPRSIKIEEVQLFQPNKLHNSSSAYWRRLWALFPQWKKSMAQDPASGQVCIEKWDSDNR